jgi:hypothetical protein
LDFLLLASWSFSLASAAAASASSNSRSSDEEDRATSAAGSGDELTNSTVCCTEPLLAGDGNGESEIARSMTGTAKPLSEVDETVCGRIDESTVKTSEDSTV